MSDYNWIDNPTENGIAICDTDVLNECLMHLKYNNQKVQNLKNCLNSGNIDAFGNSDIFDFDAPSTAVLNIPDNYTINITTAGYYSVKLIGGGGKGRSHPDMYGGAHTAYGGSGAAFVGEVYLNAGTHNITVGGKHSDGTVTGDSILYDENGNVLITAQAGRNAGYTAGGAVNGAGGILTIADGVLKQSVTVELNGGTGANGSRYNGYGQGGYGTADKGRKDGYFSIVLPSATSNISYKVGGSYPALTGTLADGQQFTLNGLNSDDITGLGDGTYIKYVGSDGSSDLLKANLTVAKTVPSTPADNDVWINNSVSPLSVKKYVAPNYTITGDIVITDGIMTLPSGTGKFSENITFSGDVLRFTGEIDISNVTSGSANSFYFVNSSSQQLWLTYNYTANKLQLYNNIDYQSYDENLPDRNVTVIECDISVNKTTGVVVYKFRYNKAGDWYGGNNNSASNKSNIATIFSSLSKTEITCNNGLSVDLNAFKIYSDDVLIYEPNFPNGWQDYNKVPVGKITLLSGGITDVKTAPYNIDYVGNNIIETYQNGTDWYRVYADGFCIQGSAEVISSSTSQTAKIRDLLKPFKDTNYTVLVAPNTSYSGDFSPLYISVKEKTTGSFTTTYDLSCSWVAYGYTKLIQNS